MKLLKFIYLLLLVCDVAACFCMLKLLLFAPLMFLPWAELFLYSNIEGSTQTEGV